MTTDTQNLLSAIARVQQVSLDRCQRWHGEAGVLDWSVLEWAGAMCGEAGEAANVAKKISRNEKRLVGNTLTDPRDLDVGELDRKLAQECADTFLYLVLLASRRNIDLGRAVVDTFNAKSAALGFPERL